MTQQKLPTDIVAKTMDWLKSWGNRKPVPNNGRPDRRRRG